MEELSAVDWLRLRLGAGCAARLLVKLVGWVKLLRLVKVGWARLVPVRLLVRLVRVGCVARLVVVIIAGSWAASLCKASNLVRDNHYDYDHSDSPPLHSFRPLSDIDYR